MMRVHVVKSEDTWILKRVAHSIQIPGITVSFRPDLRADINFFVSYQGFNKRVPGSLCVPWMTHLPHNDDDGGWRRKKFRDAAKRADFCIAMSNNTAKECPAEKTAVWGGAPDPRYVKPHLVIGVACKISRRKRPDRIEAMRQLPGVDVQVTEGKLNIDELIRWYRELDFLVVTSDTEGGPYPVMEAIAAGVPVIAPNVGWCWDYPCIRYETTEELIAILRKLRFPPDPWGAASVDLENIFQQLVGK